MSFGGFVVERRTKAGLAVGVALVAPLLEDDLAMLLFGRELRWANDWFAAADRMAAGRSDDKYKSPIASDQR